MNKSKIDKILQEGTIRQKIRLYFLDVARFNSDTLIGKEDEKRKTRPRLLTEKQKEQIYKSIVERKDIKYWEDLRIYNRAFLMFRAHIVGMRNNLISQYIEVLQLIIQRSTGQIYENTINVILDYVDKEERDKIIEKVLNNVLANISVMEVSDNREAPTPPGSATPYIKIKRTGEEDKIRRLTVEINNTSELLKMYIEGIRRFLKKKLPLKPYLDFINKEEETIRDMLTDSQEHLKNYQTNNPGQLSGLIINDWVEIEVQIDREDLEEIKKAGI